LDHPNLHTFNKFIVIFIVVLTEAGGEADDVDDDANDTHVADDCDGRVDLLQPNKRKIIIISSSLKVYLEAAI